MSPTHPLSPRIGEKKKVEKKEGKVKKFNLVPKTYMDYAKKLDRMKNSSSYLPPIIFQEHSSLSPM